MVVLYIKMFLRLFTKNKELKHLNSTKIITLNWLKIIRVVMNKKLFRKINLLTIYHRILKLNKDRLNSFRTKFKTIKWKLVQNKLIYLLNLLIYYRRKVIKKRKSRKMKLIIFLLKLTSQLIFRKIRVRLLQTIQQKSFQVELIIKIMSIYWQILMIN
jgi:hypothetical protein